jgi:hypothetical protein
MKTIKLMSVLAIMLGVMAVSAAAQSVQSDFDRSFRFSELKTFSFAVQKRPATDPLASDTLNDGRIRRGLEMQLADSGFRMETEKADFVIAYYVTTKNKLNVQDFGYGPPRWFGSRDIRVNQYSEGALMVDFIDAKSNQVIWRGRASGTLEMKGVEKKISKSVEKLIKQYLKDTQAKG